MTNTKIAWDLEIISASATYSVSQRTGAGTTDTFEQQNEVLSKEKKTLYLAN